MVGLFLATGASLASPWLVAQAIDVDIANQDLDGLRMRATQYVVLVLIAAGTTWAARVALEVVAQRAMLELKNALFDHLVDHDLATHDQHPSGTLITRVQGDTEALRVLFAEVILMLPSNIAMFLGLSLIHI